MNRILALLIPVVCATSASADLLVPRSQSRTLRVYAYAYNALTEEGYSDYDEDAAPDLGSYDASIEAFETTSAWSGASGADQQSELTSSSFTAVGSAGASRFGLESDANGSSSSVCRYGFDLMDGATFSVTIHLTAKGKGHVYVSFAQLDGDLRLLREARGGSVVDFTTSLDLGPGRYQVIIDASSDTSTTAMSNSSNATYELSIAATGVPVEQGGFGRLKSLYGGGGSGPNDDL